MWPLGRPACASGTLLIAYMPKNLRSSGSDGLNERYCAGMIWSVSMLSPKTYALPVMIDSMAPREDPHETHRNIGADAGNVKIEPSPGACGGSRVQGSGTT